jgi:GNAT superfamily N-acetyltransferase
MSTAMQEAPTATRVQRVTHASIDAAIDAWTQLAAAAIHPFAVREARDSVTDLLESPSHVFMCAYDRELPVGLAVLERSADRRVRLDALAVLPAHRQRGIGGALLTQGLFAALPATAMFVYVLEHDQARITWARDRSFRPKSATSSTAPAGTIEFELRLDAPASMQGCGCDDGCACGSGGCGH